MLRPNRLLVLIPGLLLITLIACGSDDPAPADPPLVTLADGVTVEPGSDEAEIVSVAERVVSNLRIRDIEAFQADCHPDLQAKVSVAEIAASIEEGAGYEQEVYTSEYNVVINRFRKSGDTVTVNWEHREGEDVLATDLTQVVEKADGRWYMVGRFGLCAAG